MKNAYKYIYDERKEEEKNEVEFLRDYVKYLLAGSILGFSVVFLTM
jgi:hypothetical protein